MLSARRMQMGFFVALLAVACAEPSDVAEDSAAPEVEAQRAAPQSSAEIDRLRALGYLEFSEEASDPTKNGVVRNDTARVQPGYNLYNQQHKALAILMDAQGNVLHQFFDPTAKFWARVELLPGGDLLAVGATNRGQKRSEIVEADRFVARLAWDGSPRWKRPIGAHHDVEPSPDGRLLTLVMAVRRIDAINLNADTSDDWIVELDGEGRELRRASLYELLAGGPFPFEFGSVQAHLDASAAERLATGMDSKKERDFVDLLHTNSLERMDLRALEFTSPIHRRDSLLVTSRHQDTIAVVSLDESELRWAWGRGELSGPHDATWLANGNLLVLDNGLGRKRSRVLEIEPLFGAEPGASAARIVWKYEAPEPERFYTASRGTAQRLANGNTLISNSGAGQVFEVTPGGEIVWEYLNPMMIQGGRRATIGRMKRLDASLVEPLLERFGRAGQAGRTSAN